MSEELRRTVLMAIASNFGDYQAQATAVLTALRDAGALLPVEVHQFARYAFWSTGVGVHCTLNGLSNRDAPYWHGRGSTAEEAFRDAFAHAMQGFDGEGISIPASDDPVAAIANTMKGSVHD